MVDFFTRSEELKSNILGQLYIIQISTPMGRIGKTELPAETSRDSF